MRRYVARLKNTCEQLTWHERSGSTTLKRATSPGYQCIDAACTRLMSSDAAVHTVDYQNHGGLAIIYRDAVKLRKKSLDVDVSTFEFLLGYASTNVGQFVLLAVYRPGSRALSELFFDELSAVFEQLMTYGCPVVVCGDFTIHVDDKRDIYTVHPTAAVVRMRSACDRANTQRRSHTGPGHHQERDSDFGITCW